MAKLISNIENLKIHDSSAIYDISANARSYTVQVGSPESIYGKTIDVSIPEDVNTILDNLTTQLILKDSSDADIECYNKSEIDEVVDLQNTSINQVENEVGLMEDFSPYETYYENSLVRYDGFYWRCTVAQFQGAWNPAAWRRTSLLDEIKDIRGVQTSVETLTVIVSVNRGKGQVADTSIRIVFDSGTGKLPEEIRLDETGRAVFFLDYGDRYYLEGSGISGYLNPQSQIYVAGIPKRTVQMQYRMLGSGVFIIDNNGIETDVELWDPVNNPNARFVKYTNSVLCPGGSQPDNSIIISKNWATQRASKTWQIEFKDLPSLSNIANASIAELDYNGWQNCQLAYNDCTTPNTAGKTFIDLYNDAQGTSITIAEYLPAIYYAMNTMETFMGRTMHGYIPSMGQLRQIYTNKDDINDALWKIGMSALDIEFDFWWSSSESNHYNAWRLNNSITGTNSKYYNYFAFPLFTF